MRKAKIWPAITVAAITLLTADIAAAEVLRIGGTGTANGMLGHVGAAYSAAGQDRIEVVPSLGSAGAINALADGVLDIAVSAWAPTKAEIAKGAHAGAVVRSAFGLATSRRDPNGLNSADIAKIFASPKSSWADGAPIRIILRPRSDFDSVLLASFFPGMAEALEQARQRPDVPIAGTDQDAVDLALRLENSLAGSTLTQVTMEKRDLRFVAIDGVLPTMSNFESGQYPYAKEMHFLVGADPKPAALRFIAFLKSPDGRRALREANVLSAD